MEKTISIGNKIVGNIREDNTLATIKKIIGTKIPKTPPKLESPPNEVHIGLSNPPLVQNAKRSTKIIAFDGVNKILKTRLFSALSKIETDLSSKNPLEIRRVASIKKPKIDVHTKYL